MKGPRVRMEGEETVVLSMEATLSWMLEVDYRSEVIRDWRLQEVANRIKKPVKVISNTDEVLHTLEPGAKLLEVA